MYHVVDLVEGLVSKCRDINAKHETMIHGPLFWNIIMATLYSLYYIFLFVQVRFGWKM